MSVIKQISVFNGTDWQTRDIGAKAQNITLSSTVAGSTNLETVLTNTLSNSKLTANRALVSAANQQISASNVTSTQLGFLSGTTSSIQTQLNAVNARMDTFTSLPSGSTSGNAELLDIRVGYDGHTYSNAGSAVRAQAFTGTDTTLSIAGKAADAEYVGLNVVRYDIDQGKDITQKITARRNLGSLMRTELRGEIPEDLAIADNDGNIIAGFSGGHIKTKNFDSSNVSLNTKNVRGVDIEGGKYDYIAFSDGDGDIFAEYKIGNWIKRKNCGKKISIVGDSISSYYGQMPSGTGWNPQYGKPNGIYADVTDFSKMWFSIVAEGIEGSVLFSASGGGTMVCGNSADSTGLVGCSQARVDLCSKNGQDPDIIFIAMGTNDCGTGKIGTSTITIGDFGYQTAIPSSGIITSFPTAYALLITRLMTTYPNANIYCLTIPARGTSPRNTGASGKTVAQFNAEIRKIAGMFYVGIVDTDQCGITSYNRSLYLPDNLHPNAAGHLAIARKVLDCINR